MGKDASICSLFFLKFTLCAVLYSGVQESFFVNIDTKFLVFLYTFSQTYSLVLIFSRMHQPNSLTKTPPFGKKLGKVRGGVLVIHFEKFREKAPKNRRLRRACKSKHTSPFFYSKAHKKGF